MYRYEQNNWGSLTVYVNTTETIAQQKPETFSVLTNCQTAAPIILLVTVHTVWHDTATAVSRNPGRQAA